MTSEERKILVNTVTDAIRRQIYMAGAVDLYITPEAATAQYERDQERIATKQLGVTQAYMSAEWYANIAGQIAVDVLLERLGKT